MTWICIGQGGTMLLGVILLKLLTTMGLQEYGKYALVLSASALLSSIFYGPLDQGFVRYYCDYANKGMTRYFMQLFYKSMLFPASLLFIITLSSVAAVLMFGDNKRIFFMMGGGLFIIVSATTNPFNSLLNVLRKRRENAVLQIIEKIIAIICLYGIFHFNALTTSSVFIVFSIVMVAMVIIKIRILNLSIPKGKEPGQEETTRYRKEMTKAIWKFSLPFAVWGVANWLQSNSERWIIAQYLSVSNVGIYAVTMAVATYLVAAPYGVLAQFLTPIIYERFSNKGDELKINAGHQILEQFIFLVIGVMVFSIFLTAFIGRTILLLISSAKFAEYWHILPFLCLGTGLFHIGQALTTRGLLLNVPEKYLFPKLASGFIAVCTNILCLKLMGLIGIALSIPATGLIYMAMIMRVNKKLHFIRYGPTA